jgi:hypothetical protein
MGRKEGSGGEEGWRKAITWPQTKFLDPLL